MKHIAYYPSPLGEILLCAEDKALCGLWFVGQKHYPKGMEDAAENGRCPVLQQAMSWLDRYFAGEAPPAPDFPLSPKGSEFQQRVWKILLSIPHGGSMSYGQIAKLMGRPGASQAVGGAVGKNPISIIVPCHRVLGADGSMTGYAGGIEKKQALLKLEGIVL